MTKKTTDELLLDSIIVMNINLIAINDELSKIIKIMGLR
jgi:hypothetical protein